MLAEEIEQFKKDWPAVLKDTSPRAQSVRDIAAMYLRHQDPPTYAMLIAAHKDWLRERSDRSPSQSN